MKKKIPYAVLSTALMLSLVSPVGAAPKQGIYINGDVDKYYSFSEFIASTTKTQEMNQAGLRHVKLYQDNKIATAYDILLAGGLSGALSNYANGVLPGTFTQVNGQQYTPEAPALDLAVVSASVVNVTTVAVTFSDGITQNFTVPALENGTNTKTVTYKGQEFQVTVNYTAPVVVNAAVESITFNNYRHIQVKFNQEVDLDSAANPANYYFEIVDGNSGLFGAAPDLGLSNQLSEIATNYPGGAAKYWMDGNIAAFNSQGKTLVDINLPEDARFTNVIDWNLANEDGDDERTLTVRQRASMTGPEIIKLLTKETIVNVAIRNVKNAAGKLSINTAVLPITILDETKPYLEGVYKIATTEKRREDRDARLSSPGLDKDLGSFELVRSRDNQDREQKGESLVFEYSEPVFDGHGLDKSDIERFRDLELYVNGKKIASRRWGNLDEYLSFAMGANATYNDSRLVTLDAEKAVRRTPGEYFTTGRAYNIQFVGVTDLAGNIEVASEHYFKVKFKDVPVITPVIVPPVVNNVVQVADNLFRVEFNRAGVEGKLVIENADGEAGNLKAPIPASSLDPDDGKFYSYVAVQAIDHEPYDPILNLNITRDNNVLAYDGQDYINRVVKVTNVIVKNDSVALKDLLGNDFNQGAMELKNDILAPEALAPASIDFADRAAQISIPVRDVTPFRDDNINYEVKAVKYNYNRDKQQFTNEINGFDRDYLPVKVSYTLNGVTHTALVSNRQLRPYDYANLDPAYLNPGSAGNIVFDNGNDTLNLDLADYPQLLDADGKLVEGVTYKIEFTKGYFTDAARDIFLSETGEYESLISIRPEGEIDFTFGNNNYDLLYVDDARIPQLAFLEGLGEAERARCINAWKELGYTSAEQVVNVSVGVKPPVAPPEQYVPQTSKEKIRYDAPTNSLWVEFTGTIDAATLQDPRNYAFNGKTLQVWNQELGTNTPVQYVLDNSNRENVHQYAAFIIPQDSIREDGDYAFSIEGVASPDGGKMTRVETVVGLRDNFRPIVEESKITGERQILLTFNEPVQYLVDPVVRADSFSTAKNFKVKAGDVQLTVLEAILPEVNNPSGRELTLNLGTNIPTGTITVEIVPDQNANILIIDKTQNRNPMKLATYTVFR